MKLLTKIMITVSMLVALVGICATVVGRVLNITLPETFVSLYVTCGLLVVGIILVVLLINVWKK